MDTISLSVIERCLYISGFIGCVFSLYFYFSEFGIDVSKRFGAFEGFRLTGAICADPNYSSLSFILFYALCLFRKSSVSKIGICLCWLCVICSMSKAAILAFAIGWCVYVIIIKKYRLILNKLIIVLITAFLGIIFLEVYSPSFLTILNSRFNIQDIKTGSGRSAIWAQVIDTSFDNCLIGIGLGNTSDYFKRHKKPLTTVSHNNYLDCLLEGGIICFILFVLYLFSIFMVLNYLKKNKRLYMENSLYLYVAFFIFITMSFTLSYALFRPQFALFLALVNRYSRNNIMDYNLC
jgi:O-antigen ligase